MSKIYDVIVIGGGAAGCTAALYAVRRGLKTIIFSKDVGGQAATTCEIENYPGIDFIEGPELMQKFLQSAKHFGAEFTATEVKSIHKNDLVFNVTTNDGVYETRSVILAFGLTPRSLDIPGSREFTNKGLVYSVLHNLETYQDKKVAIIGGGNTALTSAEKLAPFVSEIHIVHRKHELRAEKVLIDRVAKLHNITYHLEMLPQVIVGSDKIKQLKIGKIDEPDQVVSLSIDAVVAAIGYYTDTAWLGDLVNRTTNQSIITDKKNHTKTAGLFAAGDVTDASYKQIVISAGDGAKAALSAYEYLKEHFGIRGAVIDWGKIN